MLHRLPTQMVNWIIIISVILFVLEISFFNGGLIFSALMSALFIYVGWSNFLKLWGKILFWIGLISLIFSILNMMAVRFLILVAIIMFIYHYVKSKDEVKRIEPHFSTINMGEKESIIKIKPLFKNILFGDTKTDEQPYAWSDINISGGFGDRIIDLSYTVLPEDTAVISIRQLIGNIEIYVPYEVEISIHHSTLFGRAYILGHEEDRLLNQTISYETDNYQNSKTRVKIVTSLISGDIEVKRI